MPQDIDVPFLLVAALPPLHGGAPPATCPICGAKQVPPGSDEGLPPPEMHEYVCNASYVRPEDQPGPWEPYHRCGYMPLLAAAAWIRDSCVSSGSPAATIMQSAITVVAPYESRDGQVIEVLFGNIQGERPPESCPSCGAVGEPSPPHFWGYACGAQLMSTSMRPTATGYIPMSWVGLNECPVPPLKLLVKLLHAKAVKEANHPIATAAAAALRALEPAC